MWDRALGSVQRGVHPARVLLVTKAQDVPRQFGMLSFVACNALEHRSYAANLRPSGARSTEGGSLNSATCGSSNVIQCTESILTP